MRIEWAAVVLVSILAGCATVDPRAAFSSLEERTGQRVVWRIGGEADRTIDAEVDELLAGELSADAAVQVALLNNRSLQSTYEELAIAQADLVGAGLLKNPVFDGEVRFGEGGAGHVIEMGVVMEFLDLLYVPMRKALAGARLDSAKARVAGEVIDLAARVRMAFYDLQAAMQGLEMRRTVLEAMEASYDFARRLHAAGNLTDLQLASERAMAEQARLEVARAEIETVERREALTSLMGIWGRRTAWTVAGRLPELPADKITGEGLEKQAVERSLELAASRHGIEMAAREAGMARPLGMLSELELGVASEREADGQWSVGPGVALPLPIFSQGRPAVATADARLRQAMNDHYALAVRVRSAARTAYARVVAARQRAEYYRDVMLPLRREITEGFQRQNNAMLAGAFALLAARREEVEAGSAYVEAMRDYWVARARTEAIMAGKVVSDGGGGSSSNREMTPPREVGH